MCVDGESIVLGNRQFWSVDMEMDDELTRAGVDLVSDLGLGFDGRARHG